MPVIRITSRLPYHLRIADGAYATGTESVVVLQSRKDGHRRFTAASMTFDATDRITDAEAEQQVGRCAGQLVSRINRLLRWHRVLARRPETVEVTLGIASPFQLTVDDTGEPWWRGAFEFESLFPPPPHLITVEQLTAELRTHLGDEDEPDVALLNIADAEYSLRTGRFRETVLLCWSAIDAVFNKKYDAYVDSALSDEWAEGRDFLKSLDYRLRNKMTIGLRFVAGRSLFAEPDGFWSTLSASYTKRNRIIHEGATASESEARSAVAVARRMIDILEELDHTHSIGKQQ